MADAELTLLEKGCLGACWCAKYHYLEPWAGCGHDCLYCYARFRSPVIRKLRELGTSYEKPVPLHEPDELLRRIAEEIPAQDVRIVKLCRYTDIFSAAFVKNGLALEILKILVESQVERVIVTTKGLPDKKILSLIRKNKKKFSYNAAARPAAHAPLEPNLPPLEDRLAAIASLAKDGVLTSIHLDPVIAGLDDEEAVLRPFLERLKALGLSRIMFSYLLLNDDILPLLRRRLPPGLMKRIAAGYDLARTDRYIPGQDETASFSTLPRKKRASVDLFTSALKALNFEFVLCALKSAPGRERAAYRDAHPCDGTFYA